MSDSLSWIDDADNNRIEGLVRRSEAVIAAARHAFEDGNRRADNRCPTDLLERELPSGPATRQQRRARLRQLIRSEDPSREKVRDSRVGPGSHEQLFQDEDHEKPRKRDGSTSRHRKRLHQETAPSEPAPNYLLSTPVSFPQRLDYLTNVVIGVLATALVLSLFVRAGQSDPYRDALLLPANAKTSIAQEAGLLQPRPSLHAARGFNVLPKAFPKPLPAFAEDISGLLVLAAPVPASPGITVLPYTGLPQALPAFPEDIARLIGIASPEKSDKSPVFEQ